MPRIVCILGMHRCGTSLVARAANLLGVYLGPDSKLMRFAERNNPKGFWEHRELSGLNDEILARLGGSWHQPPQLVLGWEGRADLEDLKARARAIVQEDFGGAELWGWKDPRASLTLALWKGLLPPMRYVICLRNPVDVARSLGQRDVFSFEKAESLWMTYVEACLDQTAGHPRLLVFYEDFMADCRTELRRLARFLGIDPADAEDAVREFVDEELEHHRTPPEKVVDEGRLSFPVKALYLVVRTYVEAQRGSGDEGGKGRGLDEALVLFGRHAEEAGAELVRLRERLRELRPHLDRWAWMDRHPVWRAYLSVRQLLVRTGSRRGAAYLTGRRAWRTLRVEGPWMFLKRTVAHLVGRGGGLGSLDRQYAVWLRTHSVSAGLLDRMREVSRSFPYQPRISVVMPVYDVAEPWLRKAIDSVREQAYENWELCLVNDASPAGHVPGILDEYGARDGRIRVTHLEQGRRIAGASNAGWDAASGEFVGFLDHDDELYPHALFEVAQLLNRDRKLDFIYSDEDKIELDGRRVFPFFKPDWSPDLLLSMNYVCHFSVYRRSLLEKLGGFREGFEGSQDWDLVLRATELTDRIAHIPRVLYGWRKVPGSAAGSVDSKPYAYEAGTKLLREALARRGVEGRIEMIVPGRYHVRYRLRGRPKVSLVIPVKDRVGLTRLCIESIESRTSFRDFEIVVIDNGSVEEETRRYLERIAARHRVLRYDAPFNYAAINNLGAREATGGYLVFLNNDTEVASSEWLEGMLEHAQRREVGAVGARLLYPSGRVQHGGVFLVGSPTAFALHAFRTAPKGSPGYSGFLEAIRNWSAVTGACMMVRRAVFEELGGFDERLPVAFNDVDLCLRMRERGYLVVYTPVATLFHHESATREGLHPAEDEALVRERWRSVVELGDPYYNPNLTRIREDFGLDT